MIKDVLIKQYVYDHWYEQSVHYNYHLSNQRAAYRTKHVDVSDSHTDKFSDMLL